MSPDKKLKVKNTVLNKTNIRHYPQGAVRNQADDNHLGIATPHGDQKNVDKPLFQINIGTKAVRNPDVTDFLAERTMKKKEVVQKTGSNLTGLTGGSGQLPSSFSEMSKLDLEKIDGHDNATHLTTGILDYNLESVRSVNSNSVDLNGNSQNYVIDSVKNFKPQTYMSDISNFAIHQERHPCNNFFPKINPKETSFASTDSSYLKQCLRKKHFQPTTLVSDTHGMSPQQDVTNSYQRLEHMISCSRDHVPSVGPNVYSSQGQIYASIRGAVAQEVEGNPHSRTFPKISSHVDGSMCTPGKCFCLGDRVFSPMWEKSFPSSDELYYDCYEPGDNPEKSIPYSSPASSSFSLQISDYSMSRSSSLSSFKSIPGSPEPQETCSPTAYFSPIASTPIFSSAAVMTPNKFTFSAPPTSSSTPCFTTSSLTSTISPPFGSSRHQQSSMPVMTLFNHSVNFWIMEID